MKLEFELTEREFRQSWLAEYYRRPGLRAFRLLAGPVVFTVGAMMVRDATSVSGRAGGAIALVYGVYHALRPFMLAWLVVRKRRRLGHHPVTLRLDERGIRISSGKAENLVPWSEVTASGLGREYLWYEVRRSARAIVPFRAMPDREAVEATFRKWGHFHP